MVFVGFRILFNSLLTAHRQWATTTVATYCVKVPVSASVQTITVSVTPIVLLIAVLSTARA